jgi:hypothetical protein
MPDEQRVGEVIEACTTDFVAQCYELYQSPSLGCLVKTRGDAGQEQPGPETQIYGVVYKVLTTGMEPGRRPIARGKDEQNEDEIYRSSPQLLKLLKSEFSVLVVGYRSGDVVFQYLPPRPARIHNFVYLCQPEEVKRFSRSLDFLNLLVKARVDIAPEELIGASLRQMGQVHGADTHAFLVRAGKELAALLSRDYSQLKAILKGLKYDTAR